MCLRTPTRMLPNGEDACTAATRLVPCAFQKWEVLGAVTQLTAFKRPKSSISFPP